jgi:hypothetical protein
MIILWLIYWFFESFILLIHVVSGINPAKILIFILNTLANLAWWLFLSTLFLTFLNSLVLQDDPLGSGDYVQNDFHEGELFYFLERLRNWETRVTLRSKGSRRDLIMWYIYSKLRFESGRVLYRRLEFYLAFIQD